MKQCSVLTVCLGNICRSPAAQGLLTHVAQQQGISLQMDSAGTAAYHLGKAPDKRSIKALAEIGVDISKQAARQVAPEDFYRFDWIVAMDRHNLQHLKAMAPADSQAKVVLFGEFSPACQLGEVADPYYGETDGFITMREHLLEICQAFVTHLAKVD